MTQLVVSTVPSASKVVLDHYPVEPYIALRWSISACVFGALLIRRREQCRWETVLVAQVALLGIVGYVFSGLGTLYAVKVGGVSFFGLLTLMSPVLVVALSAVLLRERIHPRTAVALTVALVGVALVVEEKLSLADASSPVAAALLVVAAYSCDSVVFLLSKPFRTRMPLLQYMFVAQAAAGICAWLGSWAIYPTSQLLPNGIQIWSAVVYVALVSCVGAFFIWYWLLGHLEGQQLGMLQYLHGVAAFAWGVALFGEAWSWPMLLGSLALLVSVVISTAGPPSPKTRAA